jgi:hypothetical protein
MSHQSDAMDRLVDRNLEDEQRELKYVTFNLVTKFKVLFSSFLA